MGVFRIWRWVFKLFGLGFLAGCGCGCGCGRGDRADGGFRFKVDPERRRAFFGKLHEALDVLEREGSGPGAARTADAAPGGDPLAD